MKKKAIAFFLFTLTVRGYSFDNKIIHIMAKRICQLFYGGPSHSPLIKIATNLLIAHSGFFCQFSICHLLLLHCYSQRGLVYDAVSVNHIFRVHTNSSL